jgi:cytochrome c2
VKLIVRVLGGLFVLLLLGAGVFYGYFVHRDRLAPLYEPFARIERQIDRALGVPPVVEQRTALLETTFLRLRGEVFRMPQNDFINGGAMTVWGPHLLVMTHAGLVHLLDEEKRALVPLDITPPENGLQAYVELAKTPPYDSYTHTPQRVRFNDITLVDAPGLYGLALSYTHFDAAEKCYGTRISWLPLDRTVSDPRALSVAAGDWQTVFDTYPCQPLNPNAEALNAIQAGGRMVFQAPSTLYLGSGDYGLDGIYTYDGGLQSPDSALGKVMAIDLLSGASRIVSSGHRNITGLTLDAQGRLWSVEHGERGGDELNLIVEGENYGWPKQSLGTLYSGQPLPTEGTYGRHDLYRQPVFAWLPSTATSSLMTIRGIDPSWDGDLLAGSLSSEDFGQSLWHIRIEGERVVFVERIRLKLRVRHLVQFGERIAVWLDSNELVLFTAERRPDPLKVLLGRVAADNPPELAAKVTETLQNCAQCHSFEENVQAAGPSLNGVVGRPIGGAPYSGYSAALAGKGGVWDAESLKAFLSAPATFAPGTSMPDPGLAGQDDLIEAVIRALGQNDGEAQEDLRYD